MTWKANLSSIVLFTVIFVPVASFGAWGTAELEESTTAALETLKTEVGQSAYDAVTAFTVEKSTAGNSAKAKISYKDSTGVKSVSYFCHTHGGNIDCH